MVNRAPNVDNVDDQSQDDDKWVSPKVLLGYKTRDNIPGPGRSPKDNSERVEKHMPIPPRLGLPAKKEDAIERILDAFNVPASVRKDAINGILRGIHDAMDRSKFPLWKQRSGDDLKLTPPEFVIKYYSGLMKNGVLKQSIVRQNDFSLYEACHKWISRNRKADIGFVFEPSRGARDEKFTKMYGDAGANLLEIDRTLTRDRIRAIRKKESGPK